MKKYVPMSHTSYVYAYVVLNNIIVLLFTSVANLTQRKHIVFSNT